MPDHKAAEIVIIGGGVLGASAAFHLASAGYRDVILLEQGALANGTTPFAAGQTLHLSRKASALDFAAYCLEFFENFEEKTGYPIDFRQCGSLRVALTQEHLSDLEALFHSAEILGRDVRFVTPREAKQLVPALGIPQSKGILHIPRSGYVDPKSVAVAYAAAARDLGVTIRTHTRAIGLDIAEGRVSAVRTTHGSLKADWVVLAAGAWTRSFAQRSGLDIKSVPVRHQAFMTAPLEGINPDQPIVRIVEPQIYVRPESGGLLAGGYGYRPTSYDMDDLPADFEIAALKPDRIAYSELMEAVIPFFPILSEAIVIRELRGLPTVTPDSNPIVSELENAKGLIVVSGCQVSGINHSPGLGRIVADIVGGKPTLLPARELSAERFAEEYSDDTRLRSRCEHVYARLYWETH
jgi:glycine/D-amino acid oxidase-like deaminating enzyme